MRSSDTAPGSSPSAELAICGIDVRALLEAVGQSGRVPHQVDDAHRRARAPRAERADEAAFVDAEIAPLRDVAMHGIVERDATFLDQHHQRDAGERLGHGVDAEDRVFLQRAVALDVHAAERAAGVRSAPLRSTSVSAHGSLPVSRYFCWRKRSMCCRRGPDRPADSGRDMEVSCQMREVRCGSRMKMYTRSEPNTHTVTYQ